MPLPGEPDDHLLINEDVIISEIIAYPDDSLPWGISLGWYGGSFNATVVAGGDLQCTGQLYLGNGAAGSQNMYVETGGYVFANGLQVDAAAGAVGRLHVDGGTAGTNWLAMNNDVASAVDVSNGGSFTITDVYQATGLWQVLVDGWISGGVITADNGTAIPTYSIVDGDIVIVPEPATMVLLGLGGLLLRKKKI